MMIEETKNCWLRNRCSKIDCDKDFCLKKFKLDELYKLTLLADSYKEDIPLRVDLDGTDRDNFLYLKDIQTHIDKFVERGDNLYLHSLISGNGKTTFSTRMIKEYLFRVWYKCDIECKALFVHVPRFLLAVKPNAYNSDYANYIRENAPKADLVVFDEVATKELSTFEFEHVLDIINTRIDNKKANIYTSNVSNEEFVEKMGSRLYSRIVNNSIDVELFGSDKRGLFK